ncbi:STY0301 family protein [Falsiroseomonas sp. HW251]|uniref:STY0301 family protein n=1 Tax=Falsiroseomonas sp. HW251 TaxID=3390998 RepID=UPI003D312BE5
MRLLAVLIALLLPLPAMAAIACPDRLPDEGAPPPFERLGLGAGRGMRSALVEAWLVYGAPGEETKPAPAISAPDRSTGRAPRFTNSWDLDTRDPMLLVCIYGQGVWLRAPVPAGTRRCTQTGDGRSQAMRCE